MNNNVTVEKINSKISNLADEKLYDVLETNIGSGKDVNSDVDFKVKSNEKTKVKSNEKSEENSIAEREQYIENCVSQMTLEEKIGMIHGDGFFKTKGVDRLGIPPLKMSDGPMGVRNEFHNDSWIVIGHSDDYVSYAPSNSAVAATWNPVLAYKCGKNLGEEARGRGKDVILAPGINIKRDPLCGRNFEYMSEDPYIVESLAVPFIKGVQESDVAACVKHFAVNCQETNRRFVDTIVDERTLHELYLKGFRAAVLEGGSYTIMNAYNMVNGTHCSENKELLDDILRDKWGYDGVVISDWGSVHTTKGAADTSMDVEMSVTPDFDEYYYANPLIKAVKDGSVSEEKVDAKVKNVLRLMYRLKMIGPDTCSRKQGIYSNMEHWNDALETARESIVLLKNEDDILPISKERVRLYRKNAADIGEDKDSNLISNSMATRKKIAVIGHNAEHNHANGGGSAEIKAIYEISPLLGIKKALGGNVDVMYAQGYYVPGDKDVNEVNWQEASLERQVMNNENEEDSEKNAALKAEIEKNRQKYLQEACELAKEADEVIYIGGLNHDYDVEGRDRRDMKLPYGQDELINALLDINPDTIIVMLAGSPVQMPWLSRTKTLVWCYYAGMETGDALADVLFGKVNPNGKLPETFPVTYEDTVTYKNGQFGREDVIECSEGVMVGYRYYEKENIRPAYAFGYGKSYTHFKISDIHSSTHVCEHAGCNEDKISVAVSCTVENTGDMAGAEVIQCYVQDVESSVERPVKELKAYKKVFLNPGEEKNVTLYLDKHAFEFYDVSKADFIVEPGTFVIYIGNSSDNCELAGVVELE